MSFGIWGTLRLVYCFEKCTHQVSRIIISCRRGSTCPGWNWSWLQTGFWASLLAQKPQTYVATLLSSQYSATNSFFLTTAQAISDSNLKLSACFILADLSTKVLPYAKVLHLSLGFMFLWRHRQYLNQIYQPNILSLYELLNIMETKFYHLPKFYILL